jgi:hypothetical protein
MRLKRIEAPSASDNPDQSFVLHVAIWRFNAEIPYNPAISNL